jgi:hypothetical protein
MVEAKPSRDNLAILERTRFRVARLAVHTNTRNLRHPDSVNMSIRHLAQDICPSSPFRWRPNTPHDLPIPTPTENRITPIPLTHAFLWSARSSVSTRTAATARPRPNPASMPYQNLGPSCDKSRQAAGCPKNDGRSDGFLVSCRWLSTRDSDWRSAHTSLFHRRSGIRRSR